MKPTQVAAIQLFLVDVHLICYETICVNLSANSLCSDICNVSLYDWYYFKIWSFRIHHIVVVFVLEVTLNRFVALESGTKNIGSYKLKFNHTQIKPTHSSSHLGLVWLLPARQLAGQAAPSDPRPTKSDAWDCCLGQAALSGSEPNKPLSRGTRNLNSKLKYKLIKDQLVF